MTVIHNSDGMPVSPSNPLSVQPVGSLLQEQLTQTAAVAGTVTFSKAIGTLEIYNTDTVNDGVFNVNGINITVPKTESFKASFGGTQSTNVTVTGSTAYILTRYV